MRRDSITSRAVLLFNPYESITPDTEDFTSPNSSAALDACTSIVATLECCLGGGSKHASEVASFSRDTVDMYIRDQVGNDADSDDVVQRHPLMLRELKRLSDDIEILNNVAVFDGEFVKRFRQEAASRGSSLSL